MRCIRKGGMGWKRREWGGAEARLTSADGVVVNSA